MEQLNEIIQGIQSSIQVIIDALLSLAFQPIYYLIAIIQSIIDVWSEGEEEFEAEPPQQQVTVYPSANEGKYAEEVDYPACNEEHHIGYKINQAEKEELDKIKEKLNK